MTDTTPDKIDPATLDGYEPEVEGETSRERKARKARNRRRAERAQREAAAAEGKADPPPPKGRPTNASRRAAAVSGVLTMTGVAVMAFDEHDGAVIIEGAPRLADALAAVADRNPRVARALDALMETSAWGEVGLAAAAIIVPIVKHHAARPPEVEGEQVTEPTAPPESNTDPSGPAPQVSPDAPVFAVDPEPAPSPVTIFQVERP